MAALLASALLLASAACSASPSPPAGQGPGATAGTIEIGPPPATLPPASATTNVASASTVAASTAPPSTPAPVTAPPVTVACDQTDGVLTTPSGRHVLVRAAGAAPGSPLVLVLHGYTGTPTGIEKFAELTAAANAASVVVAYPEGTPVQEYTGFGWATGAGIFSTSGVDDAAALVEMLDAIIATGCVDPAHVVLAGESNGAAMSLVAVCDSRLRDRIESVVMVIPAVDGGVLGHCAPGGRAVPLTVVAGVLDQTAPYEGGRATLLPQEEWFAGAATLLNGCAGGEGVWAPVDAHVRRLTPNTCGVCTQFLAVDDGTHTWPGSSRGTGGLRPGTFDLTRRLVALAASRRPGCLAN
ncbi:MAG: PHB depolymerase family esterase [Actinomycetota bacterium]|nr:PHB depolymerase family esterase [Actinomycetota bacterium]